MLRIFLLAGWVAAGFFVDGGAGVLAQETVALKIAVVGDTGIGDRAYRPGFLAVARAMREQRPDVLLHLGDFIYQQSWMPGECRRDFMAEVRETLVAPFPERIFVPGDNDLPPHLGKPLASGCWREIDPLDGAFDPFPATDPQPGTFEGTREIGPVLVAVLNSFPWQDPTPWLQPRTESAHRRGLWVIVAVHLPPLTTAWFIDQRDTVLRQIGALAPDLVFSGNQHSYERFHALGLANGGGLAVNKGHDAVYRYGAGAVHVVSGGGGATFKPFADVQIDAEHTAPKEIGKALAARALMNHFLTLEITPQDIKATVFRVCAEPVKDAEPRWRPESGMWKNVRLECDGKPAGTDVFERFRIVRAPR
jgi:hypothetical protein